MPAEQDDSVPVPPCASTKLHGGVTVEKPANELAGLFSAKFGARKPLAKVPRIASSRIGVNLKPILGEKWLKPSE